MGFFSWLANGLGTLIGVVTEVVSTVVDTVRSVYETFVGKGGAVKDVAVEEARHKKDRLREVNDEIMHLRNRGMDRGGYRTRSVSAGTTCGRSAKSCWENFIKPRR